MSTFAAVSDCRITGLSGSPLDVVLQDGEGNKHPLADYVTGLDIRVRVNELVTAKVEFEAVALDMYFDLDLTEEQCAQLEACITKARARLAAA